MEIRPFHTSLVTTRYSYVPLKHSLAIGLFGPERDQLATPWAHAEGPDRRSTTLVEPLPDRVPPHLELFLAQLAVQVRCAMRSFCLFCLPGLGGCGGLHFCVMRLTCCTL